MSRRKNILFIVHRIPFPLDRGDRIRSFHILKFLSARANVWLATLADEQIEQSSLEELKRYCEEVSVVKLGKSRYLRGVFSLVLGNSATEGLFYLPHIQRQISQWSREVQFDSVVGFCSSVAPYLKNQDLKNIPKIIDLVDVDSEKFFEYAAVRSGFKKLLYRIEAKRLRKLETELGRLCRGVTFVTEPESEIYRSFTPTADIRFASNGIDLDYFQSATCEEAHAQCSGNSSTCLFVGALNYPPNVEGLLWFCKEVWKTIIQNFPNAKLLIVGRKPAPELLPLARLPGVHIHADVPDVRPYYQEACVAIAPLRIARGLQNKILEAFAMRTAVLSTPSALEGIEVNTNQAMIAKSAEEWIDALGVLFNNQQKRNSLADASHKYVAQNHSWETCLQPIAELLDI